MKADSPMSGLRGSPTTSAVELRQPLRLFAGDVDEKLLTGMVMLLWLKMMSCPGFAECVYHTPRLRTDVCRSVTKFDRKC